jgi:predicted lipid-binding transport protein (Tim44 family)
MFSSRTVRFASAFAALVMAFSMVTIDTAEARRGGSFGSRGARTFQSAPTTNTAPNQTAPLQRTMTPSNGQQQTRAGQQAAQPNRGGFLGGLGGGLLGGLFLGGIFGMFMGHGFGGLGGMGSLLMQVILIGGLIWLAMKFLRPKQATAGGAFGMNQSQYEAPRQPQPQQNNYGNGGGLGIPGIGSKLRGGRNNNPDEIGTTDEDLAAFEQMLDNVQGAFAREDYASLRRYTTPEMVSYLSEELADNATNGLKNEVSEVKFLQGDVAESWREGNKDYATVAMRYSSIDVTKERATGRVVQGDAERATETTEHWTFVRENGGEWKLSAIQDATTSL